MNELFKVTTNEQAWENLQKAKQNLCEEAMKPKNGKSRICQDEP